MNTSDEALERSFPKSGDVIRQEKIIQLLDELVAQQKITNDRLAVIGKALLDLLSEPVEPKEPLSKFIDTIKPKPKKGK